MTHAHVNRALIRGWLDWYFHVLLRLCMRPRLRSREDTDRFYAWLGKFSDRRRH